MWHSVQLSRYNNFGTDEQTNNSRMTEGGNFMYNTGKQIHV